MKKYWRILIVLIGTMGIVSFILDEAIVLNPDSPLHSFHIFKYFTVQSNLVAVIYFMLLFGMNIDLKNELLPQLLTFYYHLLKGKVQLNFSYQLGQS